MAPLIEVTGGFVGDLTARDNIWLTAGLHGLSKREIAARFDEIVDFAEVGDFLDTPFRHFSSGMKVRLGFSVITTLDEPIVLVDEVLAVGDRAFREKCYQRMDELLSGGRTLFLVSHNEGDLRRFCTRGLYLRGGSLVADGPLEEALALPRDGRPAAAAGQPAAVTAPVVGGPGTAGPRDRAGGAGRAAAPHGSRGRPLLLVAADLQVHPEALADLADDPRPGTAVLVSRAAGGRRRPAGAGRSGAWPRRRRRTW